MLLTGEFQLKVGIKIKKIIEVRLMADKDRILLIQESNGKKVT